MTVSAKSFVRGKPVNTLQELEDAIHSGRTKFFYYPTAPQLRSAEEVEDMPLIVLKRAFFEGRLWLAEEEA